MREYGKTDRKRIRELELRVRRVTPSTGPSGSSGSGPGIDTTAFHQGGDSFAANASLGTNDAYPLLFETGGTERMRLHEGGDNLLMASGVRIHHDSGTVALPGLAFSAETSSGRYRIGAGNVGESILGTIVSDWNASRLKLATGYKLYMGTSANIYGGAGGTDDYIANLDTVNYGVRMTFKNASTGTAAYSALSCMNDQNNAVSAGIIGSGYTIPNIHIGGEGFIVMSDGGGLGGTLKGMLVGNRLNSYLRFCTNDTERARVLSAGQWVINATTLVGAEYLRVNGAIYCDGALTAIGAIVGGSLSAPVVSATTRFSAADGTAGAPAYTFASQTTLGFYRVGSLILAVGNGTVGPLAFNATTGSENLAISSSGTFSWSSGTNAATTGADLFLARDAAAVLALKNSTTAQTMRIYGTTSGSKYLSLAHDATNAIVDASSGGIKIGVTATTIGFYNTAPTAQGTGGQNVTNNVTDTASTNGTIPDITNGTVYATDYTNLRNALFQLARMLKQDHDQLRAMGILT